MYIQGNAAYKYELQREKEEIKIIKSEKKEKKLPVLRILLSVTIVAISLSSLLFSSVQKAELATDYAVAQTTLSKLKSDNSQKEIEIETEFSGESLAQKAAELGLCQMSDKQVDYINFNNSDKAEVLKEKTWFDTFAEWVKGLFN